MRENYMTESHKIRDRITKERVTSYIVLGIIFLTFGFIITNKIHNRFLPEPLRTVKMQWEKALKSPLSTEEEIELRKGYKKVKKEINRLYPVPSVFNIFTNPFYNHKERAILEFLILIGIPFGIYVASYMWLARKKDFFYQIAEREPVSNLPDKPPYPILSSIPEKLRKKMWKDFDTFHVFLASTIKENKDLKFDYEGAKREIERLVRKVKEYFDKFYPEFNKEKLDVLTRVILWHYLISFYGNAPTGTLSIYVKDPSLKIALSTYDPRIYRKPRIYYYDKLKGKVIYYEDKIEPYLFLEGLYGADREHGIFKQIADKFCPLPFNPYEEIF